MTSFSSFNVLYEPLPSAFNPRALIIIDFSFICKIFSDDTSKEKHRHFFMNESG